jgi:hypothetical protein
MELLEGASGNVHRYNESLSKTEEEEDFESFRSLQIMEVSERDLDVQLAQHFFYNPDLSIISQKSYGSEFGGDEQEQLFEHVTKSSWKKRGKVGGAVVLGGLSGAFMTPVFLEHIESVASMIGWQLSDDDASTNALLYSTMCILMAESIFCNVNFALDERESPNGKYHWAGKSVLAIQSLLPVLMLWNIETAHQQSSQSSGLDEYMIIFMIGAMPLFTSSYLYGQRAAFDVSHDEQPLTKKEKYVAYGIPAVNSIARGIMGYALFSMALEAVSDDDVLNVTLSIIAGGLMSNAKGLLQEVNGFKRLVYDHRNSTPLSWKNTFQKTVAGVLAAYKAIPYASSILGTTDNFILWRSVLALQMFATNLTASTGTYLGFLKTSNARLSQNS